MIPGRTRPAGLRPAGALVLGVWLAAGAGLGGTSGAEEPPGPCWPGPPGTDPARCPPDDPGYARRWEFSSRIPDGIDTTRMHPSEVALGSIGFSLDTAWQLGTGRDDVVIAVLDSGIRWDREDLVAKLYLNAGELPPPLGSESHDRNGDGVFDIRDYAGDPRVGDANGNGVLDPGDLIAAFSDCVDDDGNGYPDDISGYDFFGGSRCGFAGGDNDSHDDTDFGHGTGIASTAAAQTNNGLGDAGVCPHCRVLPVRVGDTFVVDANQFARGLVFAVRAGASVVASAVGSYNNTPAARYAVDLAYRHGVPVVASAADEFSYHHNYPSVYNHTIYVNAIRHNHATDYRKATTFWGVNPCTNYGARVWVTVPAKTCSSGATSRLAGIVGLVESAARDAGAGDLHAEEVFQVLRATADDLDNGEPDWGELLYPAREGFDQLYGYGRVHARRAVAAVREDEIPPMVDLDNPRWFAIVSPERRPRLAVRGRVEAPRSRRVGFRLEYALGVEPREEDYRLVARGSTAEPRRGTLGVLNFERLPLPSGPPPRDRDDRDRYSVTLRLRATDADGRVGEARRSFFVIDDPSWKRHFPVDLDASGEASPVLADLDGDGRDEIVLPTADGYVRILRWKESGIRSVRVALNETPAVDPAVESVVGPTRDTIIRGAAVGDILGGGAPAIVVASREGRVYAFNARGERIGPFPVTIRRELGATATPRDRVESGILSGPVLADLDGEGGLEIVVTALDGHLYVWRGDGSAYPGFPVRVENSRNGVRSKIVSTPAVGDVDGDGSPEIVFGSNGIREGLTAAYAVRSEGRAHPDGPFLPGWDPVEMPALRPDLLPTLASGVSMTPLLVDVDGDGDREVIVYAVTGGSIVLLDHDGGPKVAARLSTSPGEASGFRGATFLGGTGSPLLADTDADGKPEVYAPMLPFRMLTLRAKPGVPLDVPLVLGGWRLGGIPQSGRVAMMPDFPRRMEDLMLLARPTPADVDGDGVAEVLMGSGGYLLHAFEPGGGEAEGFPKFTGGWIFSAPAAGDLDGDGRPEVVTVTREGYLFAWETAGRSPEAVTGARVR